MEHKSIVYIALHNRENANIARNIAEITPIHDLFTVRPS